MDIVVLMGDFDQISVVSELLRLILLLMVTSRPRNFPSDLPITLEVACIVCRIDLSVVGFWIMLFPYRYGN